MNKDSKNKYINTWPALTVWSLLGGGPPRLDWYEGACPRTPGQTLGLLITAGAFPGLTVMRVHA